MMRQRQKGIIIGFFIVVMLLQTTSVSAAPVVLITGFEPFSTYSVNPSQLIAESLNGTTIDGAEIIGIVLPVDFNKSVEQATTTIQIYHPDLVISLGLNARAKGIRVEKIGLNLKRFPIDNDTWSFPERLDKNGPLFRISPIHGLEVVRKIRQANISASLSFFAGTYICNSLLYQLLGIFSGQNSSVPIGFIHVPLLDSQDPEGMPLQSMVDAVKIAIQTSLEY
jgi:pyroglutamyl-peptidase